MNQRTGRAMRFCDSCEVAMGLMTLNEYTDRFINRGGLCPFCGKPAIVEHTDAVAIERKDSPWIRERDAHVKYNVSMYMLAKMIKSGELLCRHGSEYTGGRKVRENDVAKFGKRDWLRRMAYRG